MKFIHVEKARVHNLKNLSIKIPRNKFTVITGPSGSGKSSLAFNTIHGESQRRYMESLSSYARQFLGQIEPPDVENISGLSPSIAIDQKTKSSNPRSTVGTTTEIYDYMRVLFAKLGKAHSPISGEPLQALTKQEIVADIMNHPLKSRVFIFAPIIKAQKGEHKELIAKYQSMGFSKIRINGEVCEIENPIKFYKSKKNNIEIVIDRVLLKKESEPRLFDSVEQALKISKGFIYVQIDNELKLYSQYYYSHKDHKSYPPLTEKLFSFNSPQGACPHCNGLGVTKDFSKEALLKDENIPLLQGAIPILKNQSFLSNMIKSIAEKESIDLQIPYKEIPESFVSLLYKGSQKKYTYKFESENSKFHFTKTFEGIPKILRKKYEKSSSLRLRDRLESFMRIQTCQKCQGQRLKAYPLSTKIKNKSIMDLCLMPINELYTFFKNLNFEKVKDKVIGEKILKEICTRLEFMNNVGLSYLNLNRSATTLSGGESQRIRLATQIGSALSGVLYVLDEPSIGLHQRDNQKLIQTLIKLKNLGNTLIVIEHDEETMRNADFLIDIGPGAGIHGGEIVAKGGQKEFQRQKSLTADYLSGRKKIQVPKKRRPQKDFLSLTKAKGNNLKGITLRVPLNNMTCITGVSGSGKSTLIHQVLAPALKNYLDKRNFRHSNFEKLTGHEKIKSLILLDQSPIGRTPKSNPATYSKLFDHIRKIFSQTNEAKVRGYKQGRFSFNVKGGRCEECEGNGLKKIEMHFLPDVFVKCETCDGKRYNQETLNVLYRGKNIYDILNMTVEEALSFFKNYLPIKRILSMMNEVGLGYIKLGQPAPTLSGGEAQRLKLAKELSKKTRGHCLYLLDEPTTGLHFEDIKILLQALNKLVEQGNSIVVIEHNLDIIKSSDYIIDLGPEGGKNGGKVIAQGPPEEVLKVKISHTGRYLKKILS